MADLIVRVASYICLRYKQEFGARIDEMKLHKLLYFAQRESMIQLGEPLFKNCFEAWKYGPVMVSIRQKYRYDALQEDLTIEEKEYYKPVFDTVFETYAVKDSWSLSNITHGEYAWQEARKRVTAIQPHAIIMTDNIKKDAERVKIRRFLYEKMKSQNSHENN